MTHGRYANFGCGTRLHPAWINVDIRSSAPGVLVHNLREGIPFPNDSFDVVYHSHLLEHLPRKVADRFIKECFRVLRNDGIIRIAVPDLEKIAVSYLTALEKAATGNKEWEANYEWMMLELYDQTVRDESGGEMSKYLQKDSIPNEHFAYERIGVEASKIIESARRHGTQHAGTFAGRIRRHRTLPRIFSSLKEKFIAIILGADDYDALLLGRFRLSGEIHLWMYDRFSLSSLLIQAGFSNPVERGPAESEIENWSKYNLDTEADGTIYKPDSLYMEAIKP
jgi:predicted SAM-dependent methyltransferase